MPYVQGNTIRPVILSQPVRLHWLAGCIALLICLAPGVCAQSASFRSVDTNSDSVLTYDELVAAFGRTGANRLLQSTDHNGDNRISIIELRRGPTRKSGDKEHPGTQVDQDDHDDVDGEDDADGEDDGDGDDD